MQAIKNHYLLLMLSLALMWPATKSMAMAGSAEKPGSGGVLESPGSGPLRSESAEPGPELLQGANAVLRDHHTSFTVLSPAKGLMKVRYKLSILNKKAEDQARLVVPYDKLSKVKSISGEAYNAAGKQVAKLKKKDIQDRSNFNSFSIFEDNRVKTASFSIHTYPYTVVWEYEIETSNMMFYPVWAPQDREHLAVEKASMEIIVPGGFPIRYRQQHVGPVQLKRETEKDIYTWNIAGLKPVEREPYGPHLSEQLPIVFTAPSEFSVEGYAGNMDSWQSFGQWIQLLNSTQQDLPPEAVAMVVRLTEGLATEEEKVRAIYHYLQQNTRYVSIQLGIGGWQPFKASFVHNKGYGDCKALSNYTKSMLQAAGIPSYYTLIKHGDNRDYLREEFPMGYFNHAILCVPLQTDTLWLECTSQTNPFGYLGRGTSGRKVVLITEEGGKIGRTRHYDAHDNVQRTEAEVQLNAEQALVKVTRTYSGLQFENGGLHHYLHQDREEQKKWIYKHLDIPSFQLRDFQFSLEKNEVVPEIALRAELELKSLVTASNKRVFIHPNLFNRHGSAPKNTEQRQTDFIMSWSYTDEDKVVYQLPAGYQPEFMPAPQHIESKFGTYAASLEYQENKLIYSRSLQIHEGRYPAGEYEAYTHFMQEILKADQARVVLVAQ